MDESEQRYQQLIRTSPAPINLFDSTGEVIWGNDALVRLLGLASRDDLIGRSIFEFIHPANRYTAEEELTTVVEDKRATGPTMMTLERDDGETRTIRVATAPGRYNGRDIGQAVVIDVTELKQIQEELERERNLLEDALDTLDDVFYVIDTAGVLTRWNDALLELSGYSVEEVRQMDVEMLFVTDDMERVSASIARAFAEGMDTLEATVQTREGTKIPFEFRKRRLTKDGDVFGLVGIGRDISDRKTREQHLQTVDLLLQHQLRNRLNVIQSHVESLEEQISKSDNEHITEVYRAIEQIISTFDHHRHIITQLTESQRREHLDIAATIDNLISEYSDEYPEAEFSHHLPETAVVAVTPAIEYALHELFQNSINHAQTDTPTIDVSARVERSNVRIKVVDNGPPISEMEYLFIEEPDDLDSMFHPSGLGLWSVYVAVEQSDGYLTIDGDAKTGNTVTIELPTPSDEWVST